MATDPKANGEPVPDRKRLLPPRVPDGTQHFESLGRWLDNLFGDARIRRRAARTVALETEGDAGPEDPPPTEPPPPVPDGTETFTRGTPRPSS